MYSSTPNSSMCPPPRSKMSVSFQKTGCSLSPSAQEAIDVLKYEQ